MKFVFNEIKNNKSLYYTSNIIKWMMAYNLLVKGIHIPTYTVQQIIDMKDYQLNNLRKLLGMIKTNKDVAIDILIYLHKINNYLDKLPEEIIIHILENTNSKSILLLCKSSKKINNLCYSKQYRDILKNKITDDNLETSNFSSEEFKHYLDVLHLKR